MTSAMLTAEPVQSSARLPQRRARVVHVIGSLDLGGAEQVLCNLLARVDPRHFESRVITLLDRGPLRSTLAAKGVAVESLGLCNSRPNPAVIWRLARRIARCRADLVVTWLYHSNLIGGLAARLADSVPVVWNIRHNTTGALTQKQLTRWIAWCGGRSSAWLPSRIVYVGHHARAMHAQQGYCDTRAQVITNGFDTTGYRPDAAARAIVRRELGIADGQLLLGLVGRFHPDKDHRTFLRAAAQVRSQHPGARFLLCGSDITRANAELGRWLQDGGLAEHCLLLGPRNDVPRLMASLDVLVSSSATEAMPNVVGEAMACGVPCVVTDVGDSARLVGSTGRVVPARNPAALAEAALALLSLTDRERQELGQQARQRIVQEYSVDRMVAQHSQLWSELAAVRFSLSRVPTLAGRCAA